MKKNATWKVKKIKNMKEKQRDMGQSENVQPTSNQNSRKLYQRTMERKYFMR